MIVSHGICHDYSPPVNSYINQTVLERDKCHILALKKQQEGKQWNALIPSRFHALLDIAFKCPNINAVCCLFFSGKQFLRLIQGYLKWHFLKYNSDRN